MTQVERLIRNVCEEKRLALQQQWEDRKRAINDTQYTSYADLPKGVRQHLDEAFKGYAMVEKAKAAIEAHGYRAPSYLDEERKDAIQLTRKGVNEELGAANLQWGAIKEKIQRFRTNVTILCLGKTAIEAKPILLKLQKDLDAL